MRITLKTKLLLYGDTYGDGFDSNSLHAAQNMLLMINKNGVTVTNRSLLT